MPNYQKGKNYKILNNVDNEVYVGSTVELLSQRMTKRRCSMQKKHFSFMSSISSSQVKTYR